MRELNALFRKRIGLPTNESVTFETLDKVLEKTARSIPFENLCIIEKNANLISKENLIQKMLVKNEGGLCYELNSVFYFFLIENGFDAVLTRGVVYHQESQRYLNLGRTHVTILITHENQTYLVDTGFGGNLPLRPVPLSGEPVISDNGEFRIKKVESEYGDYVLEMKLKFKDTDWKTGYAFDSKKTISDVSEFNEIQTIISEHQQSPFNKNPLITKLTNRGSITLTHTTFTQWENGKMSKEKINSIKFEELKKLHFGM